MNNSRMLAGLLLLLFVFSGQSFAAQAEKYPTKSVRTVVPFPAGGNSDIVARLIIHDHLGKKMGQEFVMDNRLGASGIIGNEIVAKATPDGYTVLVTPLDTITDIPHLREMPYKQGDLACTALMVKAPLLLAVHPSLSVKTVGDLVALAKARPNKLLFASSGFGGVVHIAGELFASMAGVEMVHIPYKGIPLAILDLISGRVQIVFATPVTAFPHVGSGKLVAIAVTGMERSPMAPDVPTIAESGVGGYEVNNSVGLFVPRGTSTAIVETLNSEVNRILRMPEVKKILLETLWAVSEEYSRSDCEAWIRREHAKKGRFLKTLGLKTN